MDAYRARCNDCDVKTKIRLDESAATLLAEKHAAATGHEVTVTRAVAADASIETGDGIDAGEGRVTGPASQD